MFLVAAIGGIVTLLAVLSPWAKSPPMSFTQGRWESADGEYWIEISADPNKVAYRVPSNELGGCDPNNPEVIEGVTEWFFPDGGTGNTVYRLPFDFGAPPHPALELLVPNDWSAFAEFPCGRDSKPVILTFVDGDVAPAASG